jgi:hypothetical protein
MQITEIIKARICTASQIRKGLILFGLTQNPNFKHKLQRIPPVHDWLNVDTPASHFSPRLRTEKSWITFLPPKADTTLIIGHGRFFQQFYQFVIHIHPPVPFYINCAADKTSLNGPINKVRCAWCVCCAGRQLSVLVERTVPGISCESR